MRLSRSWCARGVLGSLLGCLALGSSLAGCDAGASYEDDSAAGTSSNTNPTPTAGAGGGATTPVNNTPAPSTVLPSLFGTPVQSGNGSSSDRWTKSDVKRDDLSYYFMANGWGPGFQSQTVTWDGTSFSVDTMQGMRGAGYEPASYPTVFCGTYSDSQSGACGLPKAVSEIQSLRTGWRWNANGNSGQYNAAYDIWLSNSADISGHSAFLMVWLRDPPGQQPAGSRKLNNVSVTNAPGSWNVWVGVVGGKPCISYVRTEGQDSPELEIDVMDFVRDTAARQLSLPGSTVLSVAVGFEIWSGPIAKLESNDFYVHVE
jgi:Glycosyl hydrolase family 12